MRDPWEDALAWYWCVSARAWSVSMPHLIENVSGYLAVRVWSPTKSGGVAGLVSIWSTLPLRLEL